MGKSRRGSREFSREQKLVHENQRLKRQLAALRKQLARLDLDRYAQVREIIEQHYQEDKAQEGRDILEKMKQEWKCHECTGGYLEIVLYNKIQDTWYYRICTNCAHRTKSQRYNPDVKGILKKATQ